MTLEEIKREVRRLDPKEHESSEAFKAQVVMLASLEVGPSVLKLTKFTGYQRSLIYKFNHNLRKSGIWTRGRVHAANWFDAEMGGIAFGCDVCVALGLMKRTAE